MLLVHQISRCVISFAVSSILFTMITLPQVHAEEDVAEKIAKLRAELREDEREATHFNSTYILTDREDRVLQGEMETLAKQAQEIFDFHVAAIKRARHEQNILLHIVDTSMQPLKLELSKLLKESDGLRAAVTQLTDARRSAESRRQAVCGYKTQSTRSPYPSGNQVRDWHRESLPGFEQARDAVGAAVRGVIGQAGLVSARDNEVNTIKKVQKDVLLIQLKLASDALAGFQEAKVLATRATEIREKLISDSEMLTSLKEKQPDMLPAVGIGYGLSPHREEEGVAGVIVELTLRWREVFRVYRDASILSGPFDPPLKPDFLQKVTTHIESLNTILPSIRQGIEQATLLDTQINEAMAQVNSIQEMAREERAAAAGIVQETKRCLDALNKAVADGGQTVIEARQALQACDFMRVESMLDQLSPGTEKEQLTQELADARAHEEKLSALVEEIRIQYRKCDYGLAETSLVTAKQMAKCPRHLESINRKIAMVKAARELEDQLRSSIDKANAKYQDCHMNDALAILNRILPQAKCADHIQSINDKIKLVQKKQDYEEETITLFNEANELYRKGKYNDALARLRKAQSRTTCQRFRDSLGKKIGIVETAMGITSDLDSAERDQDDDIPPMTCQLYHDNLNYVIEEIGKLTRQYAELKEAGGSLAELKSAACSVVDRSSEFDTISQAAREEGCAVTLQDPTVIYPAYRLRCGRQEEVVDNQTLIDSPACKRIIGRWRWFTGRDVDFLENNRWKTTDGHTGSWQCSNGGSVIVIPDQGAWQDTVTISQDGSSLSGQNQQGVPVSATRTSLGKRKDCPSGYNPYGCL